MKLNLHGNPIELRRKLCRKSFYYFVRTFWDILIPEDPVWNWHIKYLCDELQEAAELVFQKYCRACDVDIDEPNPDEPVEECPECGCKKIKQGRPKAHDIIINISPGSTKSTIASVMFPAWVPTRMPTARSICGSFTQPLGLDLSVKSRDIVTSDRYKETFPVAADLRRDQATKSHWKNTSGGSRYTCTVGGSVTGMHGHFLIIDDPLDPKGSRSKADREAANYWMNETLPSRKVDKKISVTFLIMQRLHQDDPTGNRLEKARSKKAKNKEDKVKHICLPAELTPAVRPRALRKYYVDGLMDPVRLSREVLEEVLDDGEYVYASQYLQSPVPLSGGMFKVKRLKFDIPPPLRQFKRISRAWDKAGTEGGTGAYTAGVKLGVCGTGRIWILDVVRDRLDAGEREDWIKAVAETDDNQSRPKKTRQVVEQEPGSGGKESANNTVDNLQGHVVIVDRPTGKKEERADPIASQVNRGRVYIALNPDGTKPVWFVDYCEEMQFFPESTHKDQMDGTSAAFEDVAGRKKRAGAVGRTGSKRKRSRRRRRASKTRNH